MKIVIDARESGTSTGRYIDKLLEYLNKLKPQHEIVVLTKSNRLKAVKSLAPNFDIVESEFKEFTFSEQIGLSHQISSLKPDLVHFSMTQQPVLYKDLKITTVHDLTTARFNNPSKNAVVFKLKQQVYKWVIKKAAKDSKIIITPSQYVKDDLAAFSGIDKSKIFVTHEAADKITDAPEPITQLQDTKFIMYVGRPTPHKNLDRLLEAFQILRNQDPDLFLALAGKTDALYEKYQKKVDKLGIADSVIFTGFISEGQLRWMYENTAAYVFPSLSEGFGLPGVEAMMHGAAVVSSNATCLPEVYGDAAHYFNPRDPGDIAVKVASVLNSSKLREDLIKNGHKKAKEYSWTQTAKTTLEIYNKVLK